jgi:glycopeptide antibiotics resistance protein
MGKRQTSAHILISFVFIPFVGMIRGPKDTVQNVLLFIPLGFFLPLLYERFGRLRKVAVIGFLVSLSVEIAQMFGTGTSDINDLITNTFGTCLGYGIFSLLYRTIPKSWNEKIRVKGTQGYYESILFWVGSLLIMITIQILIYRAFFAARLTGGEMHIWEH